MNFVKAWGFISSFHCLGADRVTQHAWNTTACGPAQNVTLGPPPGWNTSTTAGTWKRNKAASPRPLGRRPVPPSREIAERRREGFVELYHTAPCCDHSSQSRWGRKALMQLSLSPGIAIFVLLLVVAVVGYRLRREVTTLRETWDSRRELVEAEGRSFESGGMPP